MYIKALILNSKTDFSYLSRFLQRDTMWQIGCPVRDTVCARKNIFKLSLSI